MEEKNMPKHIAIILDGNRRWAKAQGKPGTYGHTVGAKTIKDIVKYANRIGLKYLTVYAFSTENWKRAESEVALLMDLVESYLREYTEKARNENIRIKVIGTRNGLSEKIIKSINNAEERTKDCTGLTFNVAFNYGSREEITHAVKSIASEVKDGKLNIEDITEDTITNNLYTAGIPDPDLVIRTSGEKRLSNYLLWQLAYAEFLFIDINWPEFTEKSLDDAIEEYGKRHRKFGGN